MSDGDHQKPIALQRRVMPSIIVNDIKGVSPMIGPCETLTELLRQKREAERASSDVTTDTPSPAKTPAIIEKMLPKQD